MVEKNSFKAAAAKATEAAEIAYDDAANAKAREAFIITLFSLIEAEVDSRKKRGTPVEAPFYEDQRPSLDKSKARPFIHETSVRFGERMPGGERRHLLFALQ